MFNLVKKDFLTLSKSKSDLLELLFMPFILIAILGFALGNLIMGGSNSIDTFHIGIVNEQNIEEDLIRLETDLMEQSLPEEMAAELLAGAQQIDPSAVLREVFEDESLEEIMIVNEFADTESAQEAMKEEEIAGFITIPEAFSYNVWRSIYLEEDSAATLEMTVLTNESLSGVILTSVVTTFVDQYNLETSIALATDGRAETEANTEEHGEIMSLSVEEPISAFQYYTIGMGVMFALSTAPALASRAFKEKEQHVFGRIMLSGTKPLTYLSSKMISGTLVTFIQLVILFLFSTLIFGTFKGRDFDFWIDMGYITGLYSLLIGSITSLLTSISLHSNNNNTVNFFGSFVSVFAFLGGSFTPVEQFSEALKQVGNWTPNGATMTSYLQLMQGFEFQEVLPLMLRVVGMIIICIVVAVIIFPKRRLD
ncbi:ABC transporter permease [Desemzia sp. RIT804]|uniref:ABC transporter permease n=1 Tax=Desemzia sp. RIT 804 TaxID=2810209 RepID=UPI0019512EE8|nr:ABC transporter permease [Desemzia sp. RIT 804]MBM6615655.1 ABC transporter permease [Desemzia sp. RIT 804]